MNNITTCYISTGSMNTNSKETQLKANCFDTIQEMFNNGYNIINIERESQSNYCIKFKQK